MSWRKLIQGDRDHAILLVVADADRPTSALLRCADLGRILRAPLHILSVLASGRGFAPGGQQDGWPGSRSPTSVGERAVERGIRTWLADTRGPRAATVGVRAVTGELLPRAAVRALEVDAALIAIDDRGVRTGARATALAHAAGRPVLVARSRSTSGAIVAATDLERPELPVMSPAALLARRLDVPMVAVHNVLPISMILGEDLREPVPIPPDEAVIEWTQERLAAAAAGMVACTEPVIRHALDPAIAIVEEAEARDADLVVVGSRRRAWFDRSGSGSVATRVVDRCERSVLVLPVGDGIRI